MSVIFKHDKDMFVEAEDYLQNAVSKRKMLSLLTEYGDKAIVMLSDATPVDTGLTADSWNYEIEEERKDSYKLYFYNDNVVDGVSVAILLQYGHGTRNGGYVVGDDFINPVLSQIAEELSEAVAEEARY